MITIALANEDETELGPVASITPDIAEVLRSRGWNPDQFNRMYWPAGPHRYASGWFLMTPSQVTRALTSDVSGSDNSDLTVKIKLVMFILEFDRMYMRSPVPITTSEASGPLYAVEIVDERWFWQRAEGDFLGYNMTDPSNRGILLESTQRDIGGGNVEPYTIGTAIEDVVSKIVDTTDTIADDFVDSPDTPTWNQDEIRDINADCLALPVVYQRLLTIAQYTLFPRISGDDPYRYVETGAIEPAQTVLNFLRNHLIEGGLIASQLSAPSDSAMSKAFGEPEWLSPNVPSSVDVLFPIFPEGEERRFHSINSISGRPSNFTSNGGAAIIHDTLWAIRAEQETQTSGTATTTTGEDFSNESELNARADLAAAAFYAKFKSAIGKAVFRGLREFTPFGGLDAIEWALTPEGPRTIIHCPLDSDLYIQGTQRIVRQQDLIPDASGGVYPRLDGSVLFSSAARPIMYVKVTSAALIAGKTYQWEYKGRLHRATGVDNETEEIDPPVEITFYNWYETDNTSIQIGHGQPLVINDSEFEPGPLDTGKGIVPIFGPYTNPTNSSALLYFTMAPNPLIQLDCDATTMTTTTTAASTTTTTAEETTTTEPETTTSATPTGTSETPSSTTFCDTGTFGTETGGPTFTSIGTTGTFGR